MSRRVIAAPPTLPGYDYVRPLGSGGFSDVYLFEQDLPRRVVAAKVLAGDLVTPEVIRTFNVEADVLARLSVHPSVVTIYDASISADGRPYLVMEYCPGTMAAKYRRQPLAVTEVLDAGVRIGGALETVHRAGLLHRDIKPSNILITSLGSPVLADFGIAAALAADGTDLVAFSVPWSAPEVVSSETTGTVASEVWSLGATLYTLLAGRSPFELDGHGLNSREQLTERIMSARYTPIRRPDVPQRLENALATAMSKHPSRRFPSMHAFAEELRWVQYELGIPPTNLEAAAAQWVRAGGPIDFDDGEQRGPIRSVVNPDSRRAQRLEHAAEEAKRNRDSLVARRPRRRLSPTAAAIGGATGALVVVAAVAAVLFATGVL